MSAAYWAGVADSDGSFSISKLHKNRTNPHYQAVFQLTWTANDKSKLALDSLVNEYSGSYCRAVNSSSSQYKNSKPYYKYCLTGKKLKIFLLAILPFIKLKKQQVCNLIDVLDMNFDPNATRPRLKNKAKKFEVLWRYNKMINTKNKPQATI